MSTTFFQTKIPVNQLLVDTQIPDFPKHNPVEDEAIQLMIKSQGSKIIALAHHLADNGTNPASLPIIIPSNDKDDRYYVLDGNRRLSALRLLERPELGGKVRLSPTGN